MTGLLKKRNLFGRVHYARLEITLTKQFPLQFGDILVTKLNSCQIHTEVLKDKGSYDCYAHCAKAAGHFPSNCLFKTNKHYVYSKY